jgi:hypothetical protein
VGTLVGEACLAATAWLFLLRLQRRHDEHVESRQVDPWAQPMPSEPATSGAH